MAQKHAASRAVVDLGSALIIGLISATVVVIARLRMKTLGGIIVVGVLAIAPLWKYALHGYQRNRVLAFINPALATQGEDNLHAPKATVP